MVNVEFTATGADGRNHSRRAAATQAGAATDTAGLYPPPRQRCRVCPFPYPVPKLAVPRTDLNCFGAHDRAGVTVMASDPRARALAQIMARAFIR